MLYKESIEIRSMGFVNLEVKVNALLIPRNDGLIELAIIKDLAI